MTMNPSETTSSSGPEIVNQRTFETTPEIAFKAFSNPAHLAQWWGPKGFTNTFPTFELRPGGAWDLVMQGPDGATYEIAKSFIEVVENERIVLQQLGQTHRFRMTMTFAKQEHQTAITWRMRFEDPSEGKNLADFIYESNEQNFDRLADFLAAL